MKEFDWLEKHQPEIEAICGVGAPEDRLYLIQRALAVNTSFCSVIHPTAVLTRWIQIGEGTVVTGAAS